MLIDSHCHLNMLDLGADGSDLGSVIDAAKTAGVEGILCVAVDLETTAEVIDIAERFENVWASAGLHPSNKVAHEPSIQDYVTLAEHPRVVALGEMGLDYHYHSDDLDQMRERFRCQIRAAHQVGKPVIIHTRDAREDTLAIMREEQAQQVGGVMHCFTESWEMAQAAIKMGFYISFSGIVTFKNAANVVEAAARVPLEKMLIETDAPYLTPVPYRGKPNRPQYVRYVAEQIAAIKALDYAAVAKQTTDNFFNLFNKATRI